MSVFGANLNKDADGISTAARFEDRGDGTDDWVIYVKNASPAGPPTAVTIADGSDVATGAKANAAVTDPTLSGSVISLLKGLLTNLRVAAAGLMKLEDAAHANGDAGVMGLLVRSDTPAATAGTTGDYLPATTDVIGAQWVHPIRTAARIGVDSAGLTTSTTNYTSGDTLGTELTFANAANVSGWGGVITGAVLVDKALKVNTGDVDLFIFSAASTPSADNAAANWADDDQSNLIGVIKFATADWRSVANNATNSQNGQSITYDCAATSLFGVLVTRQANAFFTAVGDLRVTLNLLKD